MYSQIKQVEISLTGDEAYTIACDIHEKLESSIRRHYYQYGWAKFISGAGPSIDLMTEFYKISGHSDLLEYQMDGMRKLLDKIAEEKHTKV